MMTRGFRQYSLWLLASCTPFAASAQLLDTTNINVAAVSSNSTAATIAAGNANGQVAMLADPVTAGGDLFDVTVSDPSVVVSLQLPGGTVVTSDNAANLGFTYSTFTNSSYVATLIAGTYTLAGAHTLITLPPAQVPGTYTLIVNASAAQGPVLVTALFFTNSPVRAGAVVTAATYQVGDTVVITGLAFDGSSPITNATVVAYIVDTNNVVANPPQIQLLDSGQYDFASGDGLYTGTFTATAPGDFRAVVQVTGTAATGNYSRNASAAFTVVPAMARFASFSDAGVDDNGNGKIDRVVVSVGVTVHQAATYQVGIALQASNGKVIKSNTISALNPGSPTVMVSFKATDMITKLGVNGPYTLRDCALEAIDGVNNPLLDYVDNEGVTAAYSLGSLDTGSQAYFTGVNTVTPLDTNGDGKFDILRVQAGVIVPTAGTYSWSANLVNSTGGFITLYDTSAPLAAGSNTINFDFNGAAIGQSCSSGVFSVRAALLYGAATSAFSPHLFDTQSLSGSQFTSAACFLVSATPNTGAFAAGAGQLFTFAYTDPNGASDLATVSAMINSSTAPGLACWVAWSRSDHTIRLYDNAGDGGYTSAPDTVNSLSNGQCTITYNNPILASGNSLTMALSIAFTKSLLGTQNIYLEAQNAGGTDSGLQPYGALTVTSTGSPCDIDGDGNFTVSDVRAMLNQVLGLASPASDLNGDRIVNVVDTQNVINAANTKVCLTH